VGFVTVIQKLRLAEEKIKEQDKTILKLMSDITELQNKNFRLDVEISNLKAKDVLLR
jgi:hypothetical protein